MDKAQWLVQYHNFVAAAAGGRYAIEEDDLLAMRLLT